MPPRLRLEPRHLRVRISSANHASQQCCYASTATATTPAPPIDQTIHSVPPVLRYPTTQPPSYKPPQFRKSQLHRQYASLLRSTPLMLLFQHNNLRSVEWMAIRRELVTALRKVDAELAAAGSAESAAVADSIKAQILQTGIFASALKVVEFYHPGRDQEPRTPHPSDPATPTSARIPDTHPSPADPGHTHSLSEAAHRAAANRKLRHGLEPLLSGPLMAVTFPTVTPQHLAAVLRTLAPNPAFPAPKRRAVPSYHEPAVQAGLAKLMLLGARVEGRVFDMEGARWVGGIQGGLGGLRGQLVAMLQGMGAGITNALEGAGRSLYFTMESRRMDLAGEGKPKEDMAEAKDGA
ncbi:hypothetical protein H2201_005501 [Coniosporium apollinis]|uniref:RNase III domain-containing protein n=1 Tax=Coniosporium apollinis TaxID=61459 RepID=A0ABQ9NT49_9PEZI|nr:hypothetical protein H2201_005501 [Coniosporium apollinis]